MPFGPLRAALPCSQCINSCDPSIIDVAESSNIVKISVLATSSSGNCTFIGTDSTRILIDAGLTRRDTLERLSRLGEDPSKLDAILITHEHSDHVSGLPVLLRKWKIPVYATHLTAPSIDFDGVEPRLETFQAGTKFTIGDIEITSFTIPHDAIDPVGYTVESQGVKFGLAMDLGYMPESVKYHLRGCHMMVLESNHDLDMLKVGPYPWSVKQRVMGRKGHLSNDIVSQFILEDLDSTVETLLLGHLSEHNNHPAIVSLVASQALEKRGRSTKLVVAEPRRQSEIFMY